MLDTILTLAKKLIAVQSVDGNHRELEEVLEIALQEVDNFTVERFEQNGYKSALVYNRSKRPELFKVLLNIHLDVIEAKQEQFHPKIEGDKLYGAGAMDMKANAACAILAFKELAEKVDYPLALQIVTDEEIGGVHGTGYQVEHEGIRSEFVIATEPTNFDIVYQAKGVLQLKVTAHGVTAHGAYPWRGKNAIEKMVIALGNLSAQFPHPSADDWQTTVNISKISTLNNAVNKIPDECSVFLDVRYISEDKDTILDAVQSIFPQDFTIETIASCSSIYTSPENVFIVDLMNVVRQITHQDVVLRGAHGTSDVSHFAQRDGAGIEFGPIGEGIGSDNEWVSIASLEKYYEILCTFLLKVGNK